VWLVSTLTIEQGGDSHVYVARSTDGVNWSPPVDAASGPTLDKNWIACDNGATSPFKGRCYLEYTDDELSTTVSQFSNDGGATWSPPLHATSILVGTQPVILPSGTLVVVAGDYRSEEALSGSMVSLRSLDGGVSFTRSTVSDLQAADNKPMRAISLPSLDVDSAGTIYAVWHDCRFRPGCLRNDMVLSTSTDGQAWTPPARVPLASASSQFSAFIRSRGRPARPGHLGLSTRTRPGSSSTGTGLMQSRDAAGVDRAAAPRRAAIPVTCGAEAQDGRRHFSVSCGGRASRRCSRSRRRRWARGSGGIFAASLSALGSASASAQRSPAAESIVTDARVERRARLTIASAPPAASVRAAAPPRGRPRARSRRRA
jgi:hypothetical protein